MNSKKNAGGTYNSSHHEKEGIVEDGKFKGSIKATKLGVLVKHTKNIMLGTRFINGMMSDELRYEQDLCSLRVLLNDKEKDRKNSISIYNICQRMNFFKKLSSGILKDAHSEVWINFFEGATYELHSKGSELIVEDDDVNTKAYVLLKGRVGIFRKTGRQAIKKQNSFIESQFERQTVDDKKVEKKALIVRQNSLISQDQEVVDEKDIEEMQNKLYEGLDKSLRLYLRNYGVMVDFIKPGNIFGEVALTTHSSRTASAITLEETELMVFTRENFEHIIKFFTNDYIDKKTYLESLIPQISEIKENKRVTQLVQSFFTKRFSRVNHLLPIERFGDKGRKRRKVYLSCTRRVSESLQRVEYQNSNTFIYCTKKLCNYPN